MGGSRGWQAAEVLRWEFRPGSTLFLVWSHDRSAINPEGDLDVGRDVSRLFKTPGRNVVQAKVSWWFGW